MSDFVMPSLGADMDEGTLVEWLVAPGDAVRRGQVVAVVDTSKSAIEVEAFVDGVVEQLLVEPGTTVPVGAPLARLGAAVPVGAGPTAAPAATESVRAVTAAVGAPGPARVAEPVASPAVSPVVRHLAHERGVDLSAVAGTGRGGAVTRVDVEAAGSQSGAPAAPPRRGPASPAAPPHPARSRPAARRRRGARPTGRIAASPLARRRAAELGVDLTTLVGSGPEGAIGVADVEAAAHAAREGRTASAPPRATAGSPAAAGPAVAEPIAPAASGRADKAAAMRAAIAALMSRSKREIPHYYLQTTVDLSAATVWLRAVNADRPPSTRILPAALLLKASALAARRYPDLNGFVVDGVFTPSEHVHLGVAVSLRGGGLIAPAIHDADTLDLDALMAALKDLVARARSGRLRGSQMSDPTITVTNLGEQGAELVHGVIYAPQVALVGFGRIVDRPWAVDGMLTVRPVVTATLAADHRVTDGHRGGQFLAAVDAALQSPEEL